MTSTKRSIPYSTIVNINFQKVNRMYKINPATNRYAKIPNTPINVTNVVIMSKIDQ
jgi:hypothetical protein